MDSKFQSSLFLLPFILVASVIAVDDPETSRDIKVMLGPFTEFSTFTKLLTETGVADEINSRETATVLIVDNSAVSPLSTLSGPALKAAISNHVLLGYYDPYYLDRLPSKPAKIDTLAKAGGVSFNENPTDQSMAFGSAEANAPYNSLLLKVVAARPYNISVIQVTSVIGATEGDAKTSTPAISEAPPTFGTISTSSTPDATAIPATPATPATPAGAAQPTTQANDSSSAISNDSSSATSPQSSANASVAQGPSSGASKVAIGVMSFWMAMAMLIGAF